MFKVIHCFDYSSLEETTFQNPFQVSEFSKIVSNFNAIRPKFSRSPLLLEKELVFNNWKMDDFCGVLLKNRETGESKPVYLAQIEGSLGFPGEGVNTQSFDYEFLLRYDVITLSEELSKLANAERALPVNLSFGHLHDVDSVKVVSNEYFNAAFV